MKRNIQLSDTTAWEALQPGEFMVFFSNPFTEVVLDEQGRPASRDTSIAVFGSMAEAERYAEEIVSHSAGISAAIYDHHGRAGDPVHRVYHQTVQRRFDPVRSARRNAWTGGSFLAAFAVWSIIAARSTDEHFLWFYILGMKLLTVGAILFFRGVGFFLGRRTSDAPSRVPGQRVRNPVTTK